MAGGPLAHEVVCLTCLFDDRVLTKATRVAEGHESDQYRCDKDHTFGLDFPDGPATEPQWPPSDEYRQMVES
jgi:hypothetical protein